MEETSSQAARPSPRPEVALLWAAGIAAALVLLAAVAWFFIPYPVSVNGQAAWVRFGTSVADLQAKGVVAAHSGDLLSVKGKMLKAQGGAPAIVTVNGQTAAAKTTLWPGAALLAANGASRTEKVVTKREAVPIDTEYKGHGPVTLLSQPGAPGVKQVTKGAVSGEVLSSKLLVKATPRVYIHTKYLAKGRVVALTFDDGPNPANTPAILAILKKNGIHATFFMIGREAASYPTLARQVAAAGHEIANHSYNHKILGHASYEFVVKQIGAGARAIKTATGQVPTWFRPPEGSLSKTVYRVAQEQGERVAMWQVDPYDWAGAAPAVIVQRVANETKPGSIILFHDGGSNRPNTIAALPIVIQQLKAKGYSFATLDEMFGAMPPKADVPSN